MSRKELLIQADEFMESTYTYNPTCKECVDSRNKYWKDAKLIKALADELRGEKWQPIETAPKDGTWYLFCDMARYSNPCYQAAPAVYKWDNDTWRDSEGENYAQDMEGQYTHWKPFSLPQPPKELDQ